MSSRITLRKSETVYLALPDHPGKTVPGVVQKSVSLDDFVAYDGPQVQLDFDEKGRLIGIEVIA